MDFKKMPKDIEESLFRPTRAAKDLARRASFSDGVIVTAVITAIAYIVGIFLSAITVLVEGGGAGSINGLFFAILLVLPVILIVILLTMIFDWIMWFIGKQLGGRAEFGVFYGEIAYATAALSLISILIFAIFEVLNSVIFFTSGKSRFSLDLLSILPLSIILLLSLIYETIFSREIHKISTAKAAVAVLVSLLLPLLVGIILVVLLVVFRLVSYVS